MSLDVKLIANVDGNPIEVYHAEITSNLAQMAVKAGIYNELWCPKHEGIETAKELIDPLMDGLDLLKADYDLFKEFNPKNGCGDIDELIKFVEAYVRACKKFPSTAVRAY